MSTDTNQHWGRKRIELPPRPPAEQYESGVTFDVVHPDDGTERRITMKQPTQERYMLDDVIEVDTPNWTAFTDELPRGVWPGSGERREICGEEIPALFCPGCGHVQRVGACCHNARCPRCWQSWDLRRTKAAAKNLSAYARVRAQQTWKTKRHHLVVSLPNTIRFNSSDPLNQAFTIGRRIMPLINVEAGYITYHPYRIAKEHRGDVPDHSSGDGDMTPADVLERVASESWSWEAIEDEYLTFEPHFHVVCVTPVAQCVFITKKIYERTGIVTHRITKPGDSKVSIEDEKDTAAVLAYNLSHCGLIKDERGRSRPPTRSFGSVERFDTDPVEDKVAAAVRSVSRRIVGLSLPSGECSAPVPKDASATAASDGNGESENTARCGTPLRKIYQAPEYLDLDAEEWDVPASRREQLLDGIEEMRSVVTPATTSPD